MGPWLGFGPHRPVEVSLSTLIAFILAAVGSWAFWHAAFEAGRQHGEGEQGAGSQELGAGGPKVSAGRRRRFGFLAVVLGATLILAFAYPLKDFSREKLSEVASGAFIAIGFLAVLGVLFWRVVRYLEQG